MKDRDGNVRILSRTGTAIILVASTMLGMMGLERAVQACSAAIPGIRTRSVWPRGDRLPTNVRLVVDYDATGLAWSTPTLPALGEDLVLLDGDAVVPTTKEIAATHIVLRPATSLLPDHTYQLGDRRTVPCQTLGSDAGGCGLVEAVQPFATFFTGSGDDTTPPMFGGITSIAVGEHNRCDSSACCGPYDSYSFTVKWAAATDGQGGTPVRYRVYQRQAAGLTLLSDGIEGTEMSGAVYCSGLWAHAFPPGRYLVRAFDGAGNEDSNTVERRLGDPCAGGGCSLAGAGATSVSLVTSTTLLLALLALTLATRQGRRATTRSR